MNNKNIILIQIMILALMPLGFFILDNNDELNNINLKIDFLEKQYNQKFPNSETTCGEGTVEINGICTVPKKIEYKF